MAALPVNVKLRCASWEQVEAIYKRDLIRNALFLKSANPPAVGTLVTVELMLPSATVVTIKGAVAEIVPQGGSGGRGPGVEIKFDYVPQSAMWIIETALARERSGDATAQTAAAALVTSINEKTRPGMPKPSDMADLVAEQQLPVASAESELVLSLAEELSSLRRLNAFQVLGVSYDATDGDIRLAFAELTKRYHPDRFAKYTSAQLRMHAADIFILIRDAYQKLGNPAQRAQLAASLAKGGRASSPGYASAAGHGPVNARAPTTPRANMPPAPSLHVAAPTRPLSGAAPTVPTPAGAQGAHGAAHGHHRPAPSPLQPSPPPPSASRAPAVRAPATPAPPQGASWMAQVESLIGAKQYDAASSVALGQLKLAPADHVAKAYLELCEGYRCAHEGDRMGAAERFETALEIDPSNDRAARELADMRRRATNERKGHLTRLMTKKD